MNEGILTLINCTVTTLVDLLTISSWFGIWWQFNILVCIKDIKLNRFKICCKYLIYIILSFVNEKKTIIKSK